MGGGVVVGGGATVEIGDGRPASVAASPLTRAQKQAPIARIFNSS
jgi:hypothetical protein